MDLNESFVNWFIVVIVSVFVIFTILKNLQTILGGRKMKSLGIVRKVDELGRVVIPIETRRSLGIKEKDPVEMFVDEEGIYIKKYKPSIRQQKLIKSITVMENLKKHGQINKSDIEVVLSYLRGE